MRARFLKKREDILISLIGLVKWSLCSSSSKLDISVLLIFPHFLYFRCHRVEVWKRIHHSLRRKRPQSAFPGVHSKVYSHDINRLIQFFKEYEELKLRDCSFWLKGAKKQRRIERSGLFCFYDVRKEWTILTFHTNGDPCYLCPHKCVHGHSSLLNRRQ